MLEMKFLEGREVQESFSRGWLFISRKIHPICIIVDREIDGIVRYLLLSLYLTLPDLTPLPLSL